jgi:transposase
MELEIVNPHCGGIDIGSRSHFVAIGQDLNDVREFGVYADDLTAICLWLRENGITSVAMESTGSYWQNLYVELSKHGFELVLANGKFTKQAKGKKTDETTEQLRTYCRQRTNWLNLAAETSSKMQKYLKLLNFRLDVVVKDVCGLTGLAIIADICNGNLNPQKLAEHRHYKCKRSKEEIAKALKGNNRQDYLFGLKQEYESYLFFQTKIAGCDKQIELFMQTAIGVDPVKKNYRPSTKNTKG